MRLDEEGIPGRGVSLEKGTEKGKCTCVGGQRDSTESIGETSQWETGQERWGGS